MKPKLIRDKIPEIAKANGEELVTKVLTNEEYKHALLEKLVEETKEVTVSNSREEELEELADVLEVLLAVLAIDNSPLEVLEELRKKKNKQRGGFNKKLMMVGKRN